MAAIIIGRGGAQFPAGLFVVFFLGLIPTDAVRAEEGTGNINENVGVPPQAKRESSWSLLEMTSGLVGGAVPIDRRVMERVKIKIYGADTSPWKSSFLGKDTLVYQTDDPRVLEAITYFLCFPLCHAMGNAKVGGGSGLLGEIVVSTTKDEFTISISNSGFELGEPSGDLSKTFYSWGLGHLLDDLCIENRGVHIPHDILLTLTGEARMNAERATLIKLKEQNQKSPRPGGPG